jgi:2-keto-myo-inositol isomerase
MLSIAAAIGCGSIVLCPNNDVGDSRTSGRFYSDTLESLIELAPLFEERMMSGLIEPLGFEECSLRSKEIAVKAIRACGYECYSVVHDTFHHYLGRDNLLYPEYTGLVHISGVESDLPKKHLRDGDRILAGPDDILRSKKQINELESYGYVGLYSLEPFALEIRQLPKGDLIDRIKQSIEYLAAD